jgi:hypothetical protein
MRTVHIKSISYYKRGRLVNRPGFTRRITPKLIRSSQRNLIKGRSKWIRMTPVQRVRTTNKGQVFKVIGKQLGIGHIPKLIKR